MSSEANDTLLGVVAAVLPWPGLTIGRVATVLDAKRLDDKHADRVRRQLEAFADWIPRRRAVPVRPHPVDTTT